VFLLALLRRDVWQTVAAGPAEGAAAQVMAETAEPAKKHGLWDKVRILAMLVVIAAPIAGAVGYVHLTKYLLLNIILSGLLLGLLALLRGVFHDVVVLLLNRQQNMPGTFNRMLEITDQSRNFLHFVLVSLIDLLILIGGVLAALSIWGMQPHEITAWIGLALQGVSIGSYTFSLTDLLLAVLIFVIVIIVTRAVQWVLEERVLPQTRLDIGVRHSLKRSIGYVGLVIALFMAVSTLGIDLSNVAIVAGALSVGIGFGLQSLVNNFVSGLILLIERPIKVGDWIVVGAQEGYVKRINVRATEITTFQQASVIIPNAEFLTNSVTNWTHKNVQGRVEVQVGVAYGTDAEKVSDILIDCAKEHPEVLTYPEPTALFMDFADSSLLFELRAFVKEIDRRRRIASDLRFAINAAFIREGVEIPFPQRVVHMPGKD
ncbi:MAG: mechanosensitive ion channel family protein, partial [Rhodospirillales bacterium]|nr:mechanosensitive ion channel family protein [Rhodospirillales bacterium]